MRNSITLFLVLAALYVNGQNSRTMALLKEGTRLEYRNYLMKPIMFSKKGNYLEITRLIFTVDSVKQIADTTFSYITKKGIAANDPRYNYVKKYILKCDSKSINTPYDFYLPDTTYICDYGQFIAYFYENNPSFEIPLSFDSANNLIKCENKMKVRAIFRQPPHVFKDEIEYNVTKMYVAGQEKVTSKAGDFDCYKLLCSGEILILGRKRSTTNTLYYNQETGLIKCEYVFGNTGYTVLSDVTISER